jgi:hypothetical protein
MIHSADNGFYLFLFEKTEDGPCDTDEWYESLREVELVCRNSYSIDEDSWTTIPDPLPGCQQDWIFPVRRTGIGVFEKYENGNWIKISIPDFDGHKT